jgi:hypothetical protein
MDQDGSGGMYADERTELHGARIAPHDVLTLGIIEVAFARAKFHEHSTSRAAHALWVRIRSLQDLLQ